MTRFVHLHTHSHYSLLDGLAKIDDLVERAKALGMNALALTDHGNLYGAIEFYKKAHAAGIKPIMGIEAYIEPERTDTKKKNYYHLILLAKNNTGWRNLMKLVTRANLHNFYYKPRMKKAWLKEKSEGLICLSACLAGEVAQLLMADQYETAKEAALTYQEIFGKGNYFLEIGHHPGIPVSGPTMEKIKKLARETGIGLVATKDIHYARPEDTDYHDILLAVQTGNKLDDPDRLTLKNDNFSMSSPEEIAADFPDTPEAITNTQVIADQCEVWLDLKATLLPKYDLPKDKTAIQYLRELVLKHAPRRYPEITPAVKERIDYELAVVEKTGFADYFLIVQDMVNWAKDRGIVVGPGRGSAAGSIISYILRITDIDPIKYQLLFERFLNPDRIQMPDIDIDFSDIRREEVMGYLREKYGEEHVAQIITFGTMAARAAIRDVGRALGISYGFCDQLAKLIPFNNNIDEALKIPELQNFYKTNADAKRILDAAKHFEGVVRHASVHACGTVIAPEKITNFVPLQRAPQGDTTIITQFEMHSIEALGLLKMDLLGLKNLTIIEETLRLIKALEGKEIDIDQIPLNDQKTFELLQRADTVGVFQLESAGMQRYLKELKPTELEDIIAMVSLYRPGPMELIPSYIARKHGREKVAYLHPRLEPILKNTYGIGVYQEQMMRIASDLAGYSLSEADTLRKAIGKKIKVLLDEQEEKLVSGMIKNGIDAKTAKQIWELFPPFARYGFNRSHGACYAMIAYRTAYLKANYPEEFMTALLNADSGDTDRIAFLVQEAGKSKIQVLPPDINRSSIQFAPEGKNIRFGLAAVKNVGEAIVRAVIEERERNGPFESLATLLERVQHKDLNKKSVESLAKCGALDSLGVERKAIIDNIEAVVRFASAIRKNENSNQGGLFATAVSQNALKLEAVTPATPAERLEWEKELLGLYISDHPLNQFREKLAGTNIRPIKDVLANYARLQQDDLGIAGVISSIKRFTTKKGDPMLFCRVEDLSAVIEVIVFQDAFGTDPNLWRENKLIRLHGRLTDRNGEVKIICKNASELRAA